ncbi:uncharacterized protein EI90DRAFT_1822575 [Cantharellus anzutake]|uniref:uncharacterized protein n=1 Tax=Cantharellus anzutake TaxID=1750568 RepID=UPI00190731DA|nr:uncharacterized protein EI90DRAFT_1822575 [Cantharellus anzutake]KAF8327162.1 hypothetical protein EI90DRAFT_1822575 [Cantharellus anzutake]
MSAGRRDRSLVLVSVTAKCGMRSYPDWPLFPVLTFLHDDIAICTSVPLSSHCLPPWQLLDLQPMQLFSHAEGGHTARTCRNHSHHNYFGGVRHPCFDSLSSCFDNFSHFFLVLSSILRSSNGQTRYIYNIVASFDPPSFIQGSAPALHK